MRRILLPMDDRNHADRAAWVVREWLRRDVQLRVEILYVTEIVSAGRSRGPRLPMSYEREVAQQIQQRMEQEVFRDWRSRVQFHHKTGPSVSQVICHIAELLACDTIVLVGQPMRGLRRWVGGSVAHAVLTRASASVFVVRPESVGSVHPVPFSRNPHRVE